MLITKCITNQKIKQIMYPQIRVVEIERVNEVFYFPEKESEHYKHAGMYKRIKFKNGFVRWENSKGKEVSEDLKDLLAIEFRNLLAFYKKNTEFEVYLSANYKYLAETKTFKCLKSGNTFYKKDLRELYFNS